MSSGDDIFLLQAAIRDRSKIDYCINSSICVSTPTLNSLENIIAQRKRWVSKNSSIQDLVYQIVAAFGFLTNLILIYILLFKSEFFLLLFVLKLIADYFLLKTFYTLINKPFQTIPFVLNSFLYPFISFISFLLLFLQKIHGEEELWKINPLSIALNCSNLRSFIKLILWHLREEIEIQHLSDEK